MARSAAPVLGARLVVVKSDLPKLSPWLHQTVADVIASSAYELEATAKYKAPVRTGTLRRSIHTVISERGLRAVVGPSVHYAIFVEFGTRFMSARPFMRPAASLVLPRVVHRLRALRWWGWR